MLGAFYIAEIARSSERKKNEFTSSPNNLREIPKTDKEKGLTGREEEGRSRPVCSLVRRSSFVRGDMGASSVDRAGNTRES